MPRTVLLIEDDEDIIQIIQYILAEIGCQVILGTPETYRKVIEEYQPNVILLDYWIYSTLGSEICIELKSNTSTKDIPVILTSAVNNVEEVAKECEADDILAKPFDIDDLTAKVEKWLSKNLSGA